MQLNREVRAALRYLDLPEDALDLSEAEQRFCSLRDAAQACGDWDAAAAAGRAYQWVVAAAWALDRGTSPPTQQAIDDARSRWHEEQARRREMDERRRREEQAEARRLEQAAAARAQAARELRAERRRANRHAASEWGWPLDWPLRHYPAWRRAGRTSDELEVWHRRGWHPDELHPLARAVLPAPPDAPAQTWRRIGADAEDALHLHAHGLTTALLHRYLEGVPDDPDLACWLLADEDRLAWVRALVHRPLADRAEELCLQADQVGPGGDAACLRLILAVAPPPDPFPPSWHGPGGYLLRLAGSRGTLMSATTSVGELVVTGDGAGLVVAVGGSSVRLPPERIAGLPYALNLLDAHDELLFAGGWEPDDIATLIAPFLEHPGDDVRIHGAVWTTNADGLPHPVNAAEHPELILAEETWGLEPGAVSMGDEHGVELIARIGPRYLYHCSDVYQWLEVRARDDTDARHQFLTRHTPGSSVHRALTRRR